MTCPGLLRCSKVCAEIVIYSIFCDMSTLDPLKEKKNLRKVLQNQYLPLIVFKSHGSGETDPDVKLFVVVVAHWLCDVHYLEEQIWSFECWP